MVWPVPVLGSEVTDTSPWEYFSSSFAFLKAEMSLFAESLNLSQVELKAFLNFNFQAMPHNIKWIKVWTLTGTL